MQRDESCKTIPQAGLAFTKHALSRMGERQLTSESVNIIITYGRMVQVRGAEIFAIGRKEVERYLKEKIDLQKYQGIQVVCSNDGAILTAYRNSNFRGLRPSRNHHCHQQLAG